MKLFTLVLSALLITMQLNAQSITFPPSGDNQKASVTQYIGLVAVTITYNSPDIYGPNGEDRTGHIWGELVPYGFTDPGYGTSNSAPWRVGANENTTISFSHDVIVDGKKVTAGTYGLFLAVEKEAPWTWIINRDADHWGHYHYNPARDVVRVMATPQEASHTEYLTFGFDERLPTSALAYMQWEKKRVNLKIEVPNAFELYVDKIRGELKGHTMGFDYKQWMDAARFCAERKLNLEEALTWADYAISGRYIGVENFETLQTKAMVLDALNKTQDAAAVMNKAIDHPTASVLAVHGYGKSLLNAGEKEKALAVFKLNRQKHPNDTFTTYVGLARGYTAVGDKKNAIKNWQVALKNLPEDQKQNRAFYEGELKKLQ